jgi:hypothetical protein
MYHLSMGALHSFPRPEPGRPGSAPRTRLADLSQEESLELLGVSDAVLAKAVQLRDFVVDHRDLARQAGIETISSEISGLLDGGRLQRVHDALGEAVSKNQPARLTEEGLSQLRRAEAILADAARQISRHTEYELSEEEGARAKRDREREIEREILDLEEQKLELGRAEARLRETRSRLEIDDRQRRLERFRASSLGLRTEPSPALGTALARLDPGRSAGAGLAEPEPSPKTDWVPLAILAGLGTVAFLVIAFSGGDARRPRRRR